MKSKILSFLYEVFRFFVAFNISDRFEFGLWGKIGVIAVVVAVFGIIEAFVEKISVKKTAQDALEQKYTSNENN
ncbi:MAG: hypothetical protein IJN43_09900 [Ruminococcus sp.]|jgi:hypothetical protein|nr:hypothetical protein [Ruminococcus sp.]